MRIERASFEQLCGGLPQPLKVYWGVWDGVTSPLTDREHFMDRGGVFRGDVFHVKHVWGVYKNKFGSIWGSCVPLGWRVG
jgi:hypothetical protein